MPEHSQFSQPGIAGRESPDSELERKGSVPFADVQPELVPKEEIDLPSWTEDPWTRIREPFWLKRLLLVVTCLATGALGCWAALYFSGVISPINDGDNSDRRKRPPVRPLPDLTAREIAEKFLHAESHEERMKWVRDPRYSSLIRQHFRSAEEIGESEVTKIKGLPWTSSPFQAAFDPFLVRFAGGRTRYLCVVREPHGFFVDWEAYARLGSATWEELLDGRAPEAEMRVFVSPDQYYGGKFADREKFGCLRIRSPDFREEIYAYVVRGTPTGTTLARWLANRRNAAGKIPPTRVTLLLNNSDPGVTGTGIHQMAVKRIVALNWVVQENLHPEKTLLGMPEEHLPEVYQSNGGRVSGEKGEISLFPSAESPEERKWNFLNDAR